MTYTREMVERLLPTVWDEDYRCYGLKAVGAPDPDMPKGYTNPSHGNNLPAYLVDVQRGWGRAELTQKERCAVLLHFGCDWYHSEIAAEQGVDRTTVTHRLFTAVGKIGAAMNGTTFTELEETEEAA